MGLALHLFIHFAFSLLAGYISWFFFGNPIFSFIGAVLGGFLIDLDHLIDYFLAFRTKVKISYFLKGYQFLKSDKIYILFHGWEYVILIIIALFILGEESNFGVALFALGLGGMFHLFADTFINRGMSLRAYSLLYRLTKRFEMKRIVTPEHYQEHLKEKQVASFLK